MKRNQQNRDSIQETAFQLTKTKMRLLKLRNPTLYYSDQTRNTVCIGNIQFSTQNIKGAFRH